MCTGIFHAVKLPRRSTALNPRAEQACCEASMSQWVATPVGGSLEAIAVSPM
jgi:hypothetical protein